MLNSLGRWRSVALVIVAAACSNGPSATADLGCTERALGDGWYVCGTVGSLRLTKGPFGYDGPQPIEGMQVSVMTALREERVEVSKEGCFWTAVAGPGRYGVVARLGKRSLAVSWASAIEGGSGSAQCDTLVAIPASGAIYGRVFVRGSSETGEVGLYGIRKNVPLDLPRDVQVLRRTNYFAFIGIPAGEYVLRYCRSSCLTDDENHPYRGVATEGELNRIIVGLEAVEIVDWYVDLLRRYDEPEER